MTSVTELAPSRPRALLTWTALEAASLVAIVVLLRLGNDPAFSVEWHRLWSWLGEHSAEHSLLGLGRVAALALVSWLAGSTLVYTAARATQVPGLIRSVEWMTLPVVRRLAGRVVAATLSVSTLATPAVALAAGEPTVPDSAERAAVVAVEPAPRYVPVPAGDTPIAPPAEDEGAGYLPTPAGHPETAPVSPRPLFAGALDPGPGRNAAAQAIGPELRPAPAPAADTAAERTVRPGDHLWGIAEAHLSEVLGRSPSDAELATYWAHLVDVNRSGLRSGDPDLIFPGEVVSCPPIAEVGMER